MADFNNLTTEQENKIIEKIMQEKPWQGFFNRPWHRFFRYHFLKITLLFYIPVMAKIFPEYYGVVMGVLFIIATAIEYRTKKIEDKITDREWVEVAIRGGIIGNPPALYNENGWRKIYKFILYHKWIIGLNVIGFIAIYALKILSTDTYFYQNIIITTISLIAIFYISCSAITINVKSYNIYILSLRTGGFNLLVGKFLVGYIEKNANFINIIIFTSIKIIYYFFMVIILIALIQRTKPTDELGLYFITIGLFIFVKYGLFRLSQIANFIAYTDIQKKYAHN